MAPGIDNFFIPSIPAWVYISFLVFFLLGYFLYATLYAAVGSMVNSTNEAQSLQWPIISLLILSILLMMGIIRNPDSTLEVVHLRMVKTAIKVYITYTNPTT